MFVAMGVFALLSRNWSARMRYESLQKPRPSWMPRTLTLPPETLQQSKRVTLIVAWSSIGYGLFILLWGLTDWPGFVYIFVGSMALAALAMGIAALVLQLRNRRGERSFFRLLLSAWALGWGCLLVWLLLRSAIACVLSPNPSVLTKHQAPSTP